MTRTHLVRRLFRGAFSLLLVVTALVTMHVLVALAIVKIVQHNKTLRARVLKPYNAAILPIAGKRFSPYALLEHVGRRSGRPYVTPLGAYPFGDGFVLNLTYGPDVDWCRNVIASGHATLKWHGHEYVLERPELIPVKAALKAIPVLLRFAAMEESTQCVWLHRT
jgi:deazaflavin-dependent oxidoreductase (nitroreductase family)